MRQHNKARSGCVTCKRRHLRCDETRPLCQRCCSSGLTCEGYQLLAALMFDYSASIEERQRMQYFIERAAPSMEICNGPNHEFWAQIVLQASFSKRCIRMALLCMSAYHQSLVDHEKSSCHQKYARSQYLRALRSASQDKYGDDVQAKIELLVISVLFRTIAVFRNDRETSLIHLQHGRFLLRDIQIMKSQSTIINYSLANYIIKPKLKWSESWLLSANVL